MKVKLIVGLVALTLSTSVMADVKEKKAIKKLISSTNKTLAKTQEMCGNSTIKVAFDFEKYTTYIDAHPEKLKIRHFTYSFAGRNTRAMLYDLKNICKDPDYKEEITKLETINVSPKSEYKDKKASFKLSEDGKILSAILPTNPFVTLGYKKQLQALW